MPSLQEIPAFFPFSLVLLIGMGAQVLGLRLRSRPLKHPHGRGEDRF